MPYPGRGHINPMMNSCKLIASRKDDVLVTFAVTEEWLGFISSDFHHDNNISLVTIPNVIPSSLVEAANFLASLKLLWPNRSSLWADSWSASAACDCHHNWCYIIMDNLLWKFQEYSSCYPLDWLASVFSINYHFHLFTEEGFPVGLMGDGNSVEFIPGISSISVADIPRIFFKLNEKFQRQLMEMRSWMLQVQWTRNTSDWCIESKIWFPYLLSRSPDSLFWTKIQNFLSE